MFTYKKISRKKKGWIVKPNKWWWVEDLLGHFISPFHKGGGHISQSDFYLGTTFSFETLRKKLCEEY